MAILHRKEEKIQAVLGRLNKNYTTEQFVEMFIKLYSKEWGKIKSAYVKQSQDKEPGTVVNMPKPALYLEQLLAKYLSENASLVEKTTEVADEVVKAPVEKKEPIKKASATKEAAEKTVKATAVKKVATKKETATAETKEKAVKAPAVKKTSTKKESATAEVKEKATKKKTAVKH